MDSTECTLFSVDSAFLLRRVRKKIPGPATPIPATAPATTPLITAPERVDASSSGSSTVWVFYSFIDFALTDSRTTPLAASLHSLVVSSSKTHGLVNNTIHPELFDAAFGDLNPAAIDIDREHGVLVVWHPDLQARIEAAGDATNESHQNVGWHLMVKIKEATCTLSASKRRTV